MYEEARHGRWGYGRALLTTLPQAAKWIDDLGFALLFEHKGQPLPALWVRATTPTPKERFDWGPEAEKVWGWKDEMPKRGLAWYGHFINARKSFLSPAMLRRLYPRAGELDDFRTLELSAVARKIAEVLFDSGAQSAATLREATATRGPAFDKAIKELGRALVVTHFGIEDQGAGWPSTKFELTTRAFEVGGAHDPEMATLRFLVTVVSCQPNHVSRALQMDGPEAKRLLQRLVERGLVTREGSRFTARKEAAKECAAPGSRRR